MCGGGVITDMTLIGDIGASYEKAKGGKKIKLILLLGVSMATPQIILQTILLLNKSTWRASEIKLDRYYCAEVSGG